MNSKDINAGKKPGDIWECPNTGKTVKINSEKHLKKLREGHVGSLNLNVWNTNSAKEAQRKGVEQRKINQKRKAEQDAIIGAIVEAGKDIDALDILKGQLSMAIANEDLDDIKFLATNIAPYQHAKKASVQSDINISENIKKMSDNELKDRVKQLTNNVVKLR